MTENRPLYLGLLCFPGLTQLDLTGPYEVLVRMPGARGSVVWKDTSPVKTEGGCTSCPISRWLTHRDSTCSWSPAA
jgi:cyclohexyl-isocyanide hydratase